MIVHLGEAPQQPLIITSKSSQQLTMGKAQFKRVLEQYIPSEAIDTTYRWLSPHRVKLKISKPRSSKLGDFKVVQPRKSYQISVNGDLNPYAFLITLTHEVAHLHDFLERKTLRDAHGASWKTTYVNLLKEVVDLGAFPGGLMPALHKHMQQPKAASCSDPTLLNALRAFDDIPITRIKDLPPGSTFSLSNGRRFRLGDLQRTRFKCLDIDRNKWYLVHGEAPVAEWEGVKS